MEYKNMKANRVIGKNLCNLRNMMGLKQEAFANELNKMLKLEFKINANYDHKTISNWEMGKSIPKMEVLIAISKKYNLSLDELLKNLKILLIIFCKSMRSLIITFIILIK